MPARRSSSRRRPRGDMGRRSSWKVLEVARAAGTSCLSHLLRRHEGYPTESETRGWTAGSGQTRRKTARSARRYLRRYAGERQARAGRGAAHGAGERAARRRSTPEHRSCGRRRPARGVEAPAQGTAQSEQRPAGIDETLDRALTLAPSCGVTALSFFAGGPRPRMGGSVCFE